MIKFISYNIRSVITLLVLIQNISSMLCFDLVLDTIEFGLSRKLYEIVPRLL